MSLRNEAFWPFQLVGRVNFFHDMVFLLATNRSGGANEKCFSSDYVLGNKSTTAHKLNLFNANFLTKSKLTNNRPHLT